MQKCLNVSRGLAPTCTVTGWQSSQKIIKESISFDMFFNARSWEKVRLTNNFFFNPLKAMKYQASVIETLGTNGVHLLSLHLHLFD